MTFIHTLNSWDTNLFLSLNSIHNTFFDGFMYAFSAKYTWIPLYISALYIIIKNWKRDAIWIVLSLVLCIIIADQVSSGIIKDLVQRPRPSQTSELAAVIHLVNDYHGGKYGFVSSHTANSIGFALLSSLLFKRKVYTTSIFLWAIITAYSRIYLGVHYPLDILGGAMVGVLSAGLCFWLLTKYRPALKIADNDLQTFVPISVLGLSFIGLIIYGFIH